MVLRKDIEKKIKEAYETYNTSHVEDHWIKVAAAAVIADSRLKQRRAKKENNPFTVTHA